MMGASGMGSGGTAIGGAGGGGTGLVGSVPISFNLALDMPAYSQGGVYGDQNINVSSGGQKWSWVVSIVVIFSGLILGVMLIKKGFK